MINITVIKNPFNYTDKQIDTCEYIPGKTVHEYVQPYIIGSEDYVVSRNGEIVEDVKAQLVGSEDWLAVCPIVGKSGSALFRTLFMIALSAYIGGLNNGVLNNGKFWDGIIRGAAVAVGGVLINHWFPAAKPDKINADPSYNWGSAQSQSGQGNALAVTYGTMRTAGQIVAQHVSSDNEKQYLNVLLCGGEGPVDSISDIRINDNPISFYSEVTSEIRLGDNDQLAIANFNETYIDQDLAYELDYEKGIGGSWHTQETSGNAVEGLEITLSFPGGLFYSNDSGGLSKTYVKIQADYSLVNSEDWVNFATDTIVKKDNTAFFRTYRIDHLSANQYKVRVKCTEKKDTTSRYSNRVFWTQLSNIMDEKFTRPGKVLLGIKALATSQLSGGVPCITWVQTRNTVWVWNATAGQYEQKSAANPAWAAYDMIHRCRYLKNINTGSYEYHVAGAPASRIVYQDFVNWAAFCDSRTLTFHYIFESANDLWTSLQKPEGVGRGKVILRGTRFGCVCDAPGQPVQLFTVGNIITDKFKETFVSQKDRANAIEISFANKDKGYQKEVITAYSDDYDEATEPNITQISLDGVTSIEQAYREAKYRLRLNQYLLRTVEHSADIDAIACQINDVVLLAHDVPQWGFSGRLLNATETTLQLDRQITLQPNKAYVVALQVTNPAATTAEEVQSIVIMAVQSVAIETTTDTITLSGSLSTVPQQWDLYSFGEANKVVKPFRVLGISRDQDLKRKITCIEYIDAVYNEVTEIPVVNYSGLEVVAEVNSISVAEETYQQKDGTMVSDLNVAWNNPRNKPITGYKVLYSSDDEQTWTELCSGITALKASVPGVKTDTTYFVKVCTINDTGVVSTGVIASVYVTGKDVLPSNVASLSAALDAADLTKIVLSWPPVEDIDLAGYRIREGSTILENLAQITTYTYAATENRTHYFTVTAVDNSGNESLVLAAADITPAICPTTPNGFTAVQNGEYVYLYWNKNNATDIAGYEVRQGALFNNGSLVKTGITGTDLSVPVSSETTYRYHIKAINNAGKYSEDAAVAEVIIYGLPPKNVILSFDEMTLQNGIHTNTIFGSSYYNCLTFPGRCSDYLSTQCNQVGGATVLKLQDGQTSGSYLTVRKDLGKLIKVNLAANFISTGLLSGGNSATLYYRNSRDGMNFEDWKVFVPIIITTRYLDFRADLSSGDPTHYPIEVGIFTETIDVDDVEKIGSATIAVGGTPADYGYTFLGGSGPGNTPVFTPTAIGSGLRAEVVSVGLSSAVVKVVNATNGTDTGGTITYRVKGYGG
ncbi:MAG: hypothetical protein H6Q66_278 [Firmicutes bacterium]|nr:hypothetical protein [Bacillota bacterium]